MKTILTNDNLYFELDQNKINIYYNDLLFSKEIELSELNFCNSNEDIEGYIYSLIDSHNFHIPTYINRDTEFITIELYIYIGQNRKDYIINIPGIKKNDLYKELEDNNYDLYKNKLIRLINNTSFKNCRYGCDLYKDTLITYLEKDDIKSFVSWYNSFINEKIELQLYYKNTDNNLSNKDKYNIFYIVNKLAEYKDCKLIFDANY